MYYMNNYFIVAYIFIVCVFALVMSCVILGVSMRCLRVTHLRSKTCGTLSDVSNYV